VGKFLREKKKAVKLYAVEPAECPILSGAIGASTRLKGSGTASYLTSSTWTYWTGS